MNFEDTQANYTSARDTQGLIEDAINTRITLGSGSYLLVRLVTTVNGMSIQYSVEGVDDINKMKRSTLNKYNRSVRAIRDWEKGVTQDFPDLSII